MKRKSLILIVSVLFIALQSCSTIEITQSRYGNGIGISFNQGTKQEEQKAAEFQKRKKQEIHDRRYAVEPVKRGLNEISSNMELEPLDTLTIPAKNQENNKQSNDFAGGIAQKTKNESALITEKNNLISADKALKKSPKNVENTQGDATNLGYLGLILIIGGAIFILLGYGAGLSILVLGVLLIVIAYFLG